MDDLSEIDGLFLSLSSKCQAEIINEIEAMLFALSGNGVDVEMN